MENPLLPLEIETEILLRLPAKSLQRFKAVCKDWLSIITSSSFISSYNHLISSSSSQLLLLKHPFPHPLLPSSLTTIHFSLSSDSFIESSTLKVPQNRHNYDGDDEGGAKLKPTRVELVTSGSINGVVCVLVYMGSSNGYVENCDLYLWNPSTNESFKIPTSEESGLFSGAPMVKFYCGFGFSSGDYKVVRVVYFQSVIPIIELYSLKLNSWKKLGSITRSRILSNILWASSTCVFVNGVGYWGAFNREKKDRFCVLGFDFEEEWFRRIRVPIECVNGGVMRYHNLWVYNGMLAMSVLRFGEFDSSITRHYIWVMRVIEGSNLEGSNLVQWVNVFNIDFEGGPRKPIACLGNGEILLLGEIDGEHALYDPMIQQVKRVDIFDVDDVVSYNESLVSFRMLMPQVSK